MWYREGSFLELADDVFHADQGIIEIVMSHALYSTLFEEMQYRCWN